MSPSKTATHDQSSKSNKEVAPFLKNLRKMLDNESDAILCWTPSGRAFEIHDMERMMNFVLPKYFKHRKYTSFQRQLNYFNFKKWTKSKAAVCTFSNDFFLRDQPDASWRITRKKSIPSSPKKAVALSVAAAESEVPLAPAAVDAFAPLWKAHDIAIVVPRTKQEHLDDASFPSPTDMDMMLLDSETDVQRYYNHIAANPHGTEDSLDWIETFLPSLEMHPKIDESMYNYNNNYHSNATMAMPSIARAAAAMHNYPQTSYFTGYGCAL